MIGFTCGTFDLFHAGHVLMLKECKNVCDYLIVGIQTDPSIDRPEKNKPIQSIVERQIQVLGCRYVDEIIVYETEKDLETILSALDINIRILGADYKTKKITGVEICEKRDIKMYFNKRDHGFSSTRLRERINDYRSDTTKS
jgi:glycerol-3-phosphate cytidylyltransferase